MCICNIVIHYNEVSDSPDNDELESSEVFGKVFKKYWVSLVSGFIAVLFSIFVFALCGFHTFLVFKALTT